MIIDDLRVRASQRLRTVAFADAYDVRVLQAARYCANNALCTPILVGEVDQIVAAAHEADLSIDGIRVVSPSTAADRDSLVHHLLHTRSSKGLTQIDAERHSLDPLVLAGWLVANNVSQAAVAGAASTTGDVVRAALWTIGLRPGLRTVSSYFLMAWPDRTLLFADAGVVPVPTSEQLADIAESASDAFASLTGRSPRIAFLSFSTKGSANHPALEPIRQGASLFAARRPEAVVDGELQADAALVPSVALRKAPNSPVGGRADVLIFPDLNSGNIAYKLCERLGGATAIGPILQGLAKPYCDLSRGCTSDDVITVAAIASLMS